MSEIEEKPQAPIEDVSDKYVEGSAVVPIEEEAKMKDEFIVDYDQLIITAYDPLKDTIRYLMIRIKSQDLLLSELQDRMNQPSSDSWNKDLSDRVSDLERDLATSQSELKDSRERVEKRKTSLLTLQLNKANQRPTSDSKNQKAKRT